MHKKEIAFAIIFAFLILGGVGGYLTYVYFGDSSEEVVLNNTTTNQSDRSLLGANNSRSTSTLGVTGTTNSSAALPQAPGPETFGEFEKYANEQNALFADIRTGTGTEVGVGDAVAVTYQGWLTNGLLFDQSRVNDQNQLEAFVFTVGDGSVIPGWDQAIVGMKVGGQRRFIVPPIVGYGEAGREPNIPSNAVLVFDVRLLEVQQAQSAAPQQTQVAPSDTTAP